MDKTYIRDCEVIIDKEELRELRLQAASWQSYQESLRRHGTKHNICPQCGSNTVNQ